MAECEEDDELDTNFNQNPKAKQEKQRKKKSTDNYLQESEDDILDFTEATSNRKILCKFNLFSIYFSLLINFSLCKVSKPKSEHNTNIHKLSSVDDSIKTAPDGRLIITDEPQAPTKSGKILSYYYTNLYDFNIKLTFLAD